MIYKSKVSLLGPSVGQLQSQRSLKSSLSKHGKMLLDPDGAILSKLIQHIFEGIMFHKGQGKGAHGLLGQGLWTNVEVGSI